MVTQDAVQDDIEQQVDTLSEAELHSALNMLQQLIPHDEIERLQPSSPNMVYTAPVALWMLTLQRLGAGKTLQAVVKDVLDKNRDIFPKNKRVQEGTLSASSAAYSAARQRLKLETVEHFATAVSNSIIETAPPTFEDRRAFIIDGTTITLEPTEELRAAFPPATNQKGESVWPVALMMVAHELQSGCALPPEIGAMYGSKNTSEAKLAKAIARRIPKDSLVLADSGFGIFGVAYSFISQGRPILFRMTKARFKSVSRQATVVDDTPGSRTYYVEWTPTKKDRSTHPELPENALLHVYLHEKLLPDGTMLYLIDSLAMTCEQASLYYERRYDVEHDIRDVKVTFKTENIRAQSVDMVRKELLTSIVAYNLVVQFRRQAAARANVLPREMSFTQVWTTMQSCLIHKEVCGIEQWQERYEAALDFSAKYDKLPKRRKPRSYARQAHTRRAKSTKFMNRNSNKPEKPK